MIVSTEKKIHWKSYLSHQKYHLRENKTKQNTYILALDVFSECFKFDWIDSGIQERVPTCKNKVQKCAIPHIPS